MKLLHSQIITTSFVLLCIVTTSIKAMKKKHHKNSTHDIILVIKGGDWESKDYWPQENNFWPNHELFIDNGMFDQKLHEQIREHNQAVHDYNQYLDKDHQLRSLQILPIVLPLCFPHWYMYLESGFLPYAQKIAESILDFYLDENIHKIHIIIDGSAPGNDLVALVSSLLNPDAHEPTIHPIAYQKTINANKRDMKRRRAQFMELYSQAHEALNEKINTFHTKAHPAQQPLINTVWSISQPPRNFHYHRTRLRPTGDKPLCNYVYDPTTVDFLHFILEKFHGLTIDQNLNELLKVHEHETIEYINTNPDDLFEQTLDTFDQTFENQKSRKTKSFVEQTIELFITFITEPVRKLLKETNNKTLKKQGTK